MKDVLCIGGWATGPAIWKPLLSTLGWDDRTICLPWWEGLMPAPSPACEPRGLLGRGLAATLAEVGRPCLLLGWSLGSLRVLEAALARPELIRGMILLAATARQTADAGYPGMPRTMVRAMRRRLTASRQVVLESFFTECLKPEVDPAGVANLVSQADSIPTDRLAAGLDYLAETDLRARLSGLNIPALVIHGQADQVVPAACGAYLAEVLPQAIGLPLPEAGHLLPWRFPQTVAAHMHAWRPKDHHR
jgi:pimeloyl-[acyl-carrier protein] methyl ester esterase